MTKEEQLIKFREEWDGIQVTQYDDFLVYKVVNRFSKSATCRANQLIEELNLNLKAESTSDNSFIIKSTDMKNIKFDQSPYLEAPVIPHILKKNEDGSLDIVTDGPIIKGDTYEILPNRGVYTITNVIESRPARGDWSGKQFEGMAPTFSRIQFK